MVSFYLVSHRYPIEADNDGITKQAVVQIPYLLGLVVSVSRLVCLPNTKIGFFSFKLFLSESGTDSPDSNKTELG